MMSAAEHELLAHALLDAIEGGALVCRLDGCIQMHNAAAVRLLRTAEGRRVANGSPPEPRAHALDGHSAFDYVEEPVLRPTLQAAATSDDAPFRLILRRSADEWMVVHVQRVGPATADAPLLLVRVQPHTPWAGTETGSYHVLRTLIENMRAPLSSIRASIETMTQYPDMGAAAAAQFAQIIEEQTVLLSTQLEAAVEGCTTLYRRAWPLVEMTASDLVDGLRRPVQAAASIPTAVEVAPEAAPVHVRVDAAALTQMLHVLVARVAHATRCETLAVRATTARQFVALDLAWTGSPVTAERLQKWKDKRLTWGTPSVEMTLGDVLDHHDAQIWSQHDEHGTRLRILLPIAGSPAGAS